MAGPKSLEQMMGEMSDPGTVELNTRYQNARDAVAWAYKMAADKVGLPSASTLEGVAINISTLARNLIPDIEADLNRTLEVLNDGKTKA